MSTEKSEQNGSKSNTSLVEVSPSSKLAAFAEMHLNGKQGILCSYDPTLPENAAMHLKATLSEITDLSTKVNTQIYVANFLMHDASRESERGDLEEWKRIVIFDKDGVPYSCGSQGVGKSLFVMFPVFGMMPWVPAVECTVKVKKLAGGRNWMWLEPTEREIANLAKRKRA